MPETLRAGESRRAAGSGLRLPGARGCEEGACFSIPKESKCGPVMPGQSLQPVPCSVSS